MKRRVLQRILDILYTATNFTLMAAGLSHIEIDAMRAQARSTWRARRTA